MGKLPLELPQVPDCRQLYEAFREDAGAQSHLVDTEVWCRLRVLLDSMFGRFFLIFSKIDKRKVELLGSVFFQGRLKPLGVPKGKSLEVYLGETEKRAWNLGGPQI